jgi:hypothetical protein
MISLETMKLYQMYLEREKKDFKHNLVKTAVENLAEYISISITLDKVNDAISYHQEVQS